MASRLPTWFILSMVFAWAVAPLSGHATGPGSVILWHNLEGAPADFLAQITREFNTANGTDLRLENGLDIRSSLLSAEGKTADVVLFAADLASLQQKLRLSEIPADLRSEDIPPEYFRAAMIGGKLYGLPILGGNHLLLYYNKTLVKKPATSWEELRAQAPEFTARGIKVIGWPIDEPYYFMYFLRTFGGDLTDRQGRFRLDSPEMTAALSFYESIAKDGLLPTACDFECANARFFKGEFAYAINGDWSLRNTRNALGKAFGVAPLPSIHGKTSQGYAACIALIFPHQSLAGPSGKQLRKFAAYLSGPVIQERWARETSRIPVNRQAIKKLLSGKDLDPDLRLSIEEAARTVALPATAQLQVVWRAVKKGIRLLLDGQLPAARTAAFMQQTAQSAGQGKP